MTTGLSSAIGYIYSALVEDVEHYLTITVAAGAFIYLLLEAYPVFQSFRQSETPTSLTLVESSQVERQKKGGSLLDQTGQDEKKNKFLNCPVFYGKYFTGDVYGASTPFIGL